MLAQKETQKVEEEERLKQQRQEGRGAKEEVAAKKLKFGSCRLVTSPLAIAQRTLAYNPHTVQYVFSGFEVSKDPQQISFAYLEGRRIEYAYVTRSQKMSVMDGGSQTERVD
ncbi:hypothetical protein AVEN_74408-1 [Araneus ventricosus]|uniref:Uncharacterized protein n=1 Tax=Araneus ventricosus TaxID=182803 RepID=A0A4Y2J865_ARAVE|nr:hypothetical protein AVEN_74408-1 [Araneus ventricosus]